MIPRVCDYETRAVNGDAPREIKRGAERRTGHLARCARPRDGGHEPSGRDASNAVISRIGDKNKVSRINGNAVRLIEERVRPETVAVTRRRHGACKSGDTRGAEGVLLEPDVCVRRHEERPRRRGDGDSRGVVE